MRTVTFGTENKGTPANAAARLAKELAAAEEKVNQVHQTVQARIEKETDPKRREAAMWEQLWQEKNASETQAHRFTELAARREARAPGYEDSGKRWLAAPELLRKVVDDYNAQGPQKRQAMRQGIAAHPEVAPHITRLLEQQRQKELLLERNRGLER